MVLVNGTTNIYRGAGGYGASAAAGLRESERVRPDYEVGFRYSPADHLEIDDALGFACENMAPYDLNGDGAVGQDEMTRLIGQQQARQMFSALDANQDGFVDCVENAAAILRADRGASGDDTPNGAVTYQDRQNFREQMQRNPFAIREQLSDFIRTLDLDQRYNRFRANPYQRA